MTDERILIHTKRKIESLILKFNYYVDRLEVKSSHKYYSIKNIPKKVKLEEIMK